MSYCDNKTVDKEVVVNDDDFFVISVIAPSNKEYCISLCKKPDAEKNIVVGYTPENEEHCNIVMNFSNFVDSSPSKENELLPLNEDIVKLMSSKDMDSLDKEKEEILDCSNLYKVVDKLSDALAIEEEITLDIISQFSPASRSVQAEAMYALLRMIIKYKGSSPADDALRHSTARLNSYIENMQQEKRKSYLAQAGAMCYS